MAEERDRDTDRVWWTPSGLVVREEVEVKGRKGGEMRHEEERREEMREERREEEKREEAHEETGRRGGEMRHEEEKAKPCPEDNINLGEKQSIEDLTCERIQKK